MLFILTALGDSSTCDVRRLSCSEISVLLFSIESYELEMTCMLEHKLVHLL